MSSVHFLVPEGYDDPREPSGGNLYDLRVIEGLRLLGRDVWVHHAADTIPPDGLTLVDGLVADRAEGHRQRLRVVLLLHMPYDGPLLDYRTRRDHDECLDGRTAAPSGAGGAAGGGPGAARRRERLRRARCCASERSIRDKGHDVLLEALAKLDDLDWTLTCVGSRDRDPGVGERAAGRRAGDLRRSAGRRRPGRVVRLQRTCWCCRRGGRATAWSSSRRRPAASR